MKENAIACPETIKKRNGTPVPFDVNKIRSAIHKANEAAQIEAIAPVQFEKLVDEVVESIPAGQSTGRRTGAGSCGRETDCAMDLPRLRRHISFIGQSTPRFARQRRIW